MDVLHPLDLQQLAADRGLARASLFLPAERGRRGTAATRIRLKNLLRLVDNG